MIPAMFGPDPVCWVSVSGGKDSTATALHLRDLGLPFRAIFADTGWEAPETYAYIAETLEPLIGPIVRVANHRGGMADRIAQKGMFPSRVRRWCTDELKVRPIFDRLLKEAEAGVNVVNVVGVRAAESRARASLDAIDGHKAKRGSFWIWRPILAWTESDVIEIHRRHGVRPNPLYLRGASRVGCYPCIYATKSDIRDIAEHHPERLDLLRSLESEVSERRGRLRTFFAGAGPEDLGGRAAHMPIDAALRWSLTGHGSRQIVMPLGNDTGCMRWGMCETSTDDDAAERAALEDAP